jgi:hypothetical protein
MLCQGLRVSPASVSQALCTATRSRSVGSLAASTLSGRNMSQRLRRWPTRNALYAVSFSHSCNLQWCKFIGVSNSGQYAEFFHVWKGCRRRDLHRPSVHVVVLDRVYETTREACVEPSHREMRLYRVILMTFHFPLYRNCTLAA